ncbi:MAG: outer membrane protein assembly factor BamD [Prevotellaceae bacterium]|jgi:outer membrane protein assembly factor BamD|nr:outer membrane protein assembly factor BamD [Prevotellaceae bacterium]
MKIKNIYLLLLSLLLVSCSEYTKLQKSTDNNLKFEKAKEYYEKKKYMHAATLFEQVLPVFKGTEKGEETLYLLGMSYLHNKDYLTARSYFASYHRSYPKGRYAEESKFNVGYSYHKDSPHPKFDQASTTKAIEELFLFSDLYPQSKRLPEVLEMVKELQEKLAYKAYLNANLYYKLGNYKGNNYQSAVIAAKNAIKEFPNSKHREELALIILKSKFQQAEKSVLEKQEDRYRDTVDEYYNFMNDFPDSKYANEAKQMFEKSQKQLK